MTPGTIGLLVTPIVAGVAVGYVLGGRLTNVAAVRVRCTSLLWLALAVQLLQFFAEPVRRVVEERIGLSMLGAIFVAVGTWLAINICYWPTRLRLAAAVLSLGVASNAFVIAVNGRMPYSPEAARDVGQSGSLITPKNTPITGDTDLGTLSDVIPVPYLDKVVSIGDLLISVGVVMAIAFLMKPQLTPGRTTSRAMEGGEG